MVDRRQLRSAAGGRNEETNSITQGRSTVVIKNTAEPQAAQALKVKKLVGIWGKGAKLIQNVAKRLKKLQRREKVAQDLKKHPKNQWFYGISLC